MSVPPELLSAMMGVPLEGGQQQAIARKLRGDHALGMLFALSGDPDVAKVGAGEMKRVQDTREGLRKARQTELQRNMTQDYYESLSENMRAGRDFDDRKFEWEQGQAPIQRQHELLLELLKNRGGRGSGTTLAMPKDVRDKLVTGNAGVEVLSNMTTALEDPEFNPGGISGLPGARTAANFAAQYGIGTQHSKETQAFWREFNRRLNLLKRNELFGATLTPNEQRSWNAAVAGAEMSKEQLKDILGAMKRWEYRELQNYAAAMKAQGRYSDEAIDILTPGLGLPGMEGPTTSVDAAAGGPTVAPGPPRGDNQWNETTTGVPWRIVE